jgi:tellurium resistance protein TerZ
MTNIAKGEKTPLLHTLKSRQRIIVGLSWDAKEEKVKLLNKLIKKDSQHDLDVSCYIYTKNGEFIDFVGAEAQDSMDESEKIYHSGDDMTGTGDGDDEFISAELASLPNNIHGIVYLAEVRSAHSFKDVDAPFIRLVDGINDNTLLESHISGEEADERNAFIFAAIYRSIESPTGWMVHNISESPDISTIEDWGLHLAQFID